MRQKDIAIDGKDDQGCTPLILAAVHNNSNSVRILLKGKADILELDKQGQNVLHKAAIEGNKDVIKEIKEFLEKDEEEGEWTMDLLMTDRDNRGNTPLMLALDSVISGDSLRCLMDIATKLGINFITSMNERDDETPIHRACR